MSKTPAPAAPRITDEKIFAALDPKLTVEESVNRLLEAEKVTGRVAILDGTAYGVDGIVGVAKGPSTNKGAGFTDVELPNKSVISVPTNLLLPV